MSQSKKLSIKPLLPVLSFSGLVVFVGDLESDEKYSSMLLDEIAVGLDFEWQPDSGQTNNHLSIAQVCTKTTCFLWLLFKFNSPPPGLYKILLSHTVLKAGCAFRSNDLRKMGISGFKVPHQKYELPVAFIDICELKLNGKGVYVKSLEKLVQIYLGKSLPVATNAAKSNWTEIEENQALCEYAILDCYAPLLIFEKSDFGRDYSAASVQPTDK